MGWPGVVEKWLENQGNRQTESYMKRGRSLAAVSTDELTLAWIKEFRAWTKNPTHRHQAMTDVEVELTIRGKDVPLDEVETEWENLRKSFTTIPVIGPMS